MPPLTDKQIKAKFRPEFVKEYKKFYPVRALSDLGFRRGICKKCRRTFWSLDLKREVCGEPTCTGGFSFIGKTPAKKKLNYIEAWEKFEKTFKKMGYLSVPRKPVVARWRNDVYWTGASVYGFQPYVVSGEIEPPSNAVIIPQLCLRFNDVDNVGITGSHYVCFDMFGQLRFEKKKDYDPGTYIQDYLYWLETGMGIPRSELVLHEDSWAGGGTFGPSMEFFSAGLEIGNQVYMQYAATPAGYKELDIKVLDMGQGHERVPWFTHGENTSYETTFPTVVEYLKNASGIKPEKELMQRFLPYSAYLNVDEVEDINKTWGFVAKGLGMDVKELKEKILPARDLYAIAEHSRAVLAALNDGALFSNVGGGYNIRAVTRRMFALADERGWEVDYAKLLELHAHFLRNLYPELGQNLDDVNEILAYEKEKYSQTKFKSKQIIQGIISRGGKVGGGELAELYDSHGINPEVLVKEASQTGLKIEIPENFFGLVAGRHAGERTEPESGAAGPLLGPAELQKIPATERLYYGNHALLEFEGKVLFAKNKIVVLDCSAFYPTSGGQEHDTGEIDGWRVADVLAQENRVLHLMGENTKLKKGQRVKGVVDKQRRIQLTQHHDGTHILNYACREILGKHCWQHGSHVGADKARFDVTHYKPVSEEESKKIEGICNRLVKESLPIRSEFLPRNVAEEKYGMCIYQGGYVPGKKLRILSIADLDAEACGGTHASSTGAAGLFKILGTSKIQDGVIRITFACGDAAKKTGSENTGILEETAKLLGVGKDEVPSAAENLFRAWKQARKLMKKRNPDAVRAIEAGKPAREAGLTEEELLRKAALAFSTRPEHVPSTARRFLNDLKKWKGA